MCIILLLKQVRYSSGYPLSPYLLLGSLLIVVFGLGHVS
jgi:hypothetical protein